MDPIKAQKIRALKLYNKKSDYFFQSLILHSILALACSLFCSYSHLFPNSFYTIKHLLFNSLPNCWSWFVNPSCLFIVANFIVVFLIGESKIGGNQTSEDHVYDEYVAKTRSLRRNRPTTIQVIEKEEKIVEMTMEDLEEDNAKGIEDVVEEVVSMKGDSDEPVEDEDFKECEGNVTENEIQDEKEEEEKEMVEEDRQEEEKEEEKEEAIGLPAEDLNKRVEDFIARVNKQRWLEARFLVCSARM